MSRAPVTVTPLPEGSAYVPRHRRCDNHPRALALAFGLIVGPNETCDPYCLTRPKGQRGPGRHRAAVPAPPVYPILLPNLPGTPGSDLHRSRRVLRRRS